MVLNTELPLLLNTVNASPHGIKQKLSSPSNVTALAGSISMAPNLLQTQKPINKESFKIERLSKFLQQENMKTFMW